MLVMNNISATAMAIYLLHLSKIMEKLTHIQLQEEGPTNSSKVKLQMQHHQSETKSSSLSVIN